MTIATTAPMAGVERSSMNSIVFASCFGTIIEWYDFLIYATAAAVSEAGLSDGPGTGLRTPACCLHSF